jgi:hypothetical protein
MSFQPRVWLAGTAVVLFPSGQPADCEDDKVTFVRRHDRPRSRVATSGARIGFSGLPVEPWQAGSDEAAQLDDLKCKIDMADQPPPSNAERQPACSAGRWVTGTPCG